MKTKIVLLIMAAILFWSCGSDSTDPVAPNTKAKIYGVITDAVVNTPLQGATVSITPGGGSVNTGADGIYEFNNLEPNADYTIKVVKAGYSANEKTIRVNSSESRKLDIALTQLGASFPTCSITYPTAGLEISIGTTVTITANAADTDGSIKIVRFYIGATQAPVDSDAVAPYAGSWGITGQAAGDYVIKAIAEDNADNKTPAQVMIKLVTGNTAPTCEITSPGEGAPIASGAIVTMKANATDADGSIKRVDFYLDDALKGTANAAPYEGTWNTASYASGVHKIHAIAVDNLDKFTQSVVVSVQLRPSCTISNLSNGQNIIIGTQQPIQTSSTVTLKKVEFFVDDVSLVVINSSPFNTIWNTTGYSTGNHTLKIIATDMSNLTVKDTKTVNLVRSNPLVNITAPVAGAIVKIGESVVITAGASDPAKRVKGRSVDKVEFFADGVSIGTSLSAPYSRTWATTGVSAGVHTLKAVVTDNSGNTSFDEISVNLVNNAPTIVITEPVNGANLVKGSTVTIKTQVTDFNKSKSVAKVEFFLDNNSMGAAVTTAPYEFIWSNIAANAGVHVVKVKVTDNDGLTAEDSVSINIVE